MAKKILFFIFVLQNFTSTTFAIPTCNVSATVASTNITCRGAGDGTITISSPIGGGGTYQYSINGGTSWLNSGSFTGLGVSTHIVQIRDKANTSCFTTLNAALSITQPAVLNATVVASNVTCYGANDGIISFNSASGGNGNYNYSIDNGQNWQSSFSFASLSPNTYDLKIQDAACISVVTSLGTKTISQPVAAVSATVVKTDITCHGAADGSITVSGLGGYGTYQYSMNGGSTWLNNGGIFTGLGVSTHDIQIRDKANPSCFYDYGSVSIIQPGLLTGTVNHTDITCFGNIDGTITINSAGGGSGNYEYRVDGGTWQNSNSFSGLTEGLHTVEIQDLSTSCTNSLFSPTILQPSGALTATVNSTNVTCFGANDGTITISAPSGGYGTYQYSKDGGINWLNNGGNFSGLAWGSYDVRIRDKANQGCSATLNGSLSISRPAKLDATVTSTNVTCNGANNGTITISSPSGGPSSLLPGGGTYNYSIDGGATFSNSTGIFDNLPPSSATLSYDVWIQDATDVNCTVELGPLTITEKAPLGATVVSTNVSCYGSADGTITISSPLGGYGTYQYSKDGGTNWLNNGGNFSGLAFGIYDVRIRDKANQGCSATLNGSLSITRPARLNATVTSTNVTCNGANDGTITISSPSGGPSSLLPGEGTYKYSIDGGTTFSNSTGTFNSLPPSSLTLSYDVWIQDATDANCTFELGPLTITEPAPIIATVNSTEVTCFGAVDGTITISSPSGGSGTYQYSKNGGTNWLNNGGSFTGLAYGTYNVQIRDKAHTGCYTVLNNTLIITRPPKLNATVASTNVTCDGSNDGTITITSPSGGPSSLLPGGGTYKYSIDGGTTFTNSTGIFNNLSPSSATVSYDVWIQDAIDTNCTIDLGTQTIYAPDIPIAGITNNTATTILTCSTTSISATATGGGTYSWSDGTTVVSSVADLSISAP